jgi:hypothetical protein
MKLTKRKAFNFLRSYFDVLNELKTDSDKLQFLEAVINKQFLDEDPEDLNFVVNLCYQSQRHQIEKSVKGWKLASSKAPPKGGIGSDPKGGVVLPPKEEKEKEKEKEKEEEKEEVKEKEKVEHWNNSQIDVNGHAKNNNRPQRKR